MTPEVAILGCVSFFVGGLLGSGAAMLSVARDKRVVVLRPGQIVVDGEAYEALQARVERVGRNPLKHDPRAKVKPPEEDFGDDDDDEEEGPPATEAKA